MDLIADTRPLAPTNRASQMRSRPQEQLAAGSVGYLASLSRVDMGVHLATLRHFDNNVGPMVENGPLIPCERRLAEMEILEFQEATS